MVLLRNFVIKRGAWVLGKVVFMGYFYAKSFWEDGGRSF